MNLCCSNSNPPGEIKNSSDISNLDLLASSLCKETEDNRRPMVAFCISKMTSTCLAMIGQLFDVNFVAIMDPTKERKIASIDSFSLLVFCRKNKYTQTMVSLWRENMLGYFFTLFVCSDSLARENCEL